MSRFKNFIITSEFATLKNLRTINSNITIPSGSIIAPNQTGVWEQNIPIENTAGSIERTSVYSNRNNIRVIGNSIYLQRSGYGISLSVYKTSQNNLRISAEIFNPTSSNITTGAEEIFDFTVNIFVSPIVI